MSTETTTKTTTTNNKKWFPLESNPESMNKYLQKLGFETSSLQFVDVFSTEDWALSMIPQPAVALILLYPITAAQETFRAKEASEVAADSTLSFDGVWYMKQRIQNACGTIGVLHAIANLPAESREAFVKPDSWLGKYLAACPTSMDPVKKAEVLEASEEIGTMHNTEATSSQSNQTSRPSSDDNVDAHFVAFVNVNGTLWELDGRKETPISHGPSASQTFLADAIKVVDKFMKRDPGELRFTMLALAAAVTD